VTTYPRLPVDVREVDHASRQMIVVLTDEEMKEFEELLNRDVAPDSFIPVAINLGGSLRTGTGIVAFSLARRVWQLARRHQRLATHGQPILYVDLEAAGQLNFEAPPVHDVVYAAHPVSPLTYLPVASFHTDVFESKVADAFELLRGLGATKIELRHNVGWSASTGGRVDAAGAQQGDVGGGMTASRSEGSAATMVAEFEPRQAPHVPDGIVWLQTEPLWRAVVNGRIEGGMTNFSLEIRYDKDHGIDADFAGKLQKNGFKLGGEFKRHQETVWTMEGTFAAASPSVD
jgi:hypothetical protein